MSSLISDNKRLFPLLYTEEIYALKGDFSTTDHESFGHSISPIKSKSFSDEVVAKVQTAKDLSTPSPNLFFDYMGENNRYILVLINNAEHPYLHKNDFDFLLKIIQAKQWELKDIALLNLHHYSNVTIQQLKIFFSFNKLIAFDIHPNAINFNQNSLNTISKLDTSTTLFTHSLGELQSDKSKKIAFWNILKEF